MQGNGADGRIKSIVKQTFFVILILLLVFADIFAKRKILELSKTSWQSTEIIKNFFYVKYSFNTGAAWSFLDDVSWGQTFFKILTSVALVVMVFVYILSIKKKYLTLQIGMVLVIAGTVGNFIDRILLGGVVDFISLVFGTYRFPVFNFADSFLTVGVILVIIHLLFLSNNSVFNNGKTDKKRDR